MSIKQIQYRIDVTPSSSSSAFASTSSFVLWPKVIELIDERDSLFVWDSSRLISAYLATERSLFQQEKYCVLELGAGLGLPSIVAALRGAKNVYITERAEEITTLDNIKKIIEINDVGDRCQSFPLTWGE
jgi:predicted nicotinamide N-methyase